MGKRTWRGPHGLTISQENRKMGQVASVSMMPGAPPDGTCVAAEWCAKGCNAIRMLDFTSVAPTWAVNTALARQDMVSYFLDVLEYVKEKRPAMFRWHVGGDILDQDYFDCMKKIANAWPSVMFLAFTKAWKDGHVVFKDIPGNLSVVVSVWPGHPLPRTRLPRAYLQSDKRLVRLRTGLWRVGERRVVACQGTCETCQLCYHLPHLKVDVALSDK